MTYVPEKAKQIALARLDLVHKWLEFRRKSNIKIQADYDFLKLHNTTDSHLRQVLGKVSRSSIHRWNAMLDGSEDYEKLLPQYRYSQIGEFRTTLTDEEIKIFMSLLLHPNRFSIGKATALTKYKLKEQGQDFIPADATFRRYAKWFKANNYDKWTLARDGEKALKDKVSPFIVRNASLLKAGQVLVADGHTLNFQVINPFSGKPCRATLLGFLDWKSGGLVGYDIMLEECTQNIASALRNAILKLDHIPEYVYQDNGRTFRGKYFTGSSKFDEQGFIGIYEKLGIKPIFATPYNARAKVIERFFLDFQESFEKLIPSYIGTSIENKPAYMKRNEKLHNKIHEKYNFTPTIEQTRLLIEKWLEFKHSQPCPNDKGKTIQEVLNEIEKQNIDENLLDNLMMAQEIKTSGRNGIRFLKADYFDEALYGIREKTVIKYSLFDLSYIKVYSMKGEFICKANRVTETHPLANEMGDIKDIEDYKQKIEKQQKLRRKTIKAVKEHFKIEDLDLIEKELLFEDIKPKIEPVKKNQAKPKTESKKEFEPKVKTSIVARPIFKNNYERYEWHMKNGCICNDDRVWLAKYIQSDEYKEIYN